MGIQALGYIGLHASNLEDWSGFATGVLGLQLAGRSNAELAFRMDDRKQRLVVARDATDGPAFFGWGPLPQRWMRGRRGWRRRGIGSRVATRRCATGGMCADWSTRWIRSATG